MADTTLTSPGDDIGTAEVTRSVTHTPPVDILETEHELLVFADMPGVRQNNLDIRFDNGELTLHGRRGNAADRAFLFRESRPADYFRSFQISEKVDSEKIWAELKCGVLTLHLPKAEAAKPRKIAVKGG